MTHKTLFTISPVRTTADLQATTTLFHDYATSLAIDLSFQSFDAEITNMPGKYSPPTGELLLARNSSGDAVGCAALRALDLDGGVTGVTGVTGVCEIKRLYVAPAGRGMGLGKALAQEIISIAVRLGYVEMRLDTLPSMIAAIGLYESLGFVDVPAYYATPLEGTRFLSLGLRPKP